MYMEKQDDTNTTQATKAGSHSRKKMIIGVIAVLMLLGIFGALFLIGAFDEPKSQESIIEENVEKNSRLVGQRKYDEALAAWGTFVKDNPSPGLQVRAYKEIASVHLNKDQNYSAALESYQKAEDLTVEPDYGLLVSIATVSEEMGDLTTARSYYKKALSALGQENPLYQVEKVGLEEKLEMLK